MGRKCFVPNCKSGYEPSEKRIRAFRAPKDPRRLTAWAKAIGRTDRPLTSDCYVCERHFPSTAIKKQKWFVEYKGNVLLEQPKKPVLLPDAVPSLCLLTPPPLTTPDSGEALSTGAPNAKMSAPKSAEGNTQERGKDTPERTKTDSMASPAESSPVLPLEMDVDVPETETSTAPEVETTEPPSLEPKSASSAVILNSLSSTQTSIPMIISSLSSSTRMSTPVILNSLSSSTQMSTPVILNSLSSTQVNTTAPMALKTTLSSLTPKSAPLTPLALKSTFPLTPMNSSTPLPLNTALPPLTLKTSTSTLLLMPVALIKKPANRPDASIQGVPKEPAPGDAGKMSSALAFKVTMPAPPPKPAVVTPKRVERSDTDTNLAVKDEVLSEDSRESGSSDESPASFAEPAAVKDVLKASGAKANEPHPGPVRMPLSMALRADQVLLPSPAWNHHDVDMEANARSLCFVELMSSPTAGPPFTRRILQIVESASAGYSINCYVLDREVEVTVLPAGSPPPTVEEIAETLQDFHARTVCSGGLPRRDLPGARFEQAWLDKTGVWRHDRCLLLLSAGAADTRCRFCASLPNPFSTPVSTLLDKPKPQSRHSVRNRVKTEA
ncbi:hypothetical protein V5799_029449 [Amblyomma americanum]|uniref:THAP-type domain-containing protein n=1 Tax=Amblyomma americanum TaxID=6943 RepID=A0AAQ4EQZ5_AMBAM